MSDGQPSQPVSPGGIVSSTVGIWENSPTDAEDAKVNRDKTPLYHYRLVRIVMKPSAGSSLSHSSLPAKLSFITVALPAAMRANN